VPGAGHYGPSGDHTASRAPDGVPLHYARHRPEQTTLYRLVQQHAASFVAHTEASTGSRLPRFVTDEFDAFLQCGVLAHGFLRLRCGECGHDTLLAFSSRSGAGSARRAVRGAFRRRRRTWWITSSRRCRCGSGFCRCRYRCGCCRQRSPSWSRWRWAWCSACSSDT
jgi:hypothetical protein